MILLWFFVRREPKGLRAKNEPEPNDTLVNHFPQSELVLPNGISRRLFICTLGQSTIDR